MNLIKEDLSRSHKTKTKTKTDWNTKGLFLLNPDELLFNGLEFIKNLKNNEVTHRSRENAFLEK